MDTVTITGSTRCRPEIAMAYPRMKYALENLPFDGKRMIFRWQTHDLWRFWSTPWWV